MKNIVLTGFMGTGKSIIGKGLAQKLQMEFLDTDQMIEEEAGLNIPEIFSDQRAPAYAQADHSVDTTGLSSPQIVRIVIRRVNRGVHSG